MAGKRNTNQDGNDKEEMNAEYGEFGGVSIDEQDNVNQSPLPGIEAEIQPVETETEETDDSPSTTGFNCKLNTDQYKGLVLASRKTGISRDMLVDMALQALFDADERNIELYYQIAVARKGVDFATLKGLK